MSGDLFETCIETFRAAKVKEVSFVFTQQGLKLIANTTEADFFSEALLYNNEFEIYSLTSSEPVEFAVELKVLLNVLKSSMKFKTFLKYPVGDNKLAVIIKNDRFITQYLLDTREASTELSILPSDRIVVDLGFNTPQLLKQAIDLVAGGKHNIAVFLKLEASDKDFFKLIKEDLTVKTMVNFQQIDTLERRKLCAFEMQYSSFALKKLSAFHVCRVVDLKVHDEGMLEFLFIINQDASIKCYIPALSKTE